MLTIRLALAALIVSAMSCTAFAKKIEARLPKTFVSTKIVDRVAQDAPDPSIDDSPSWGIDDPLMPRSAKPFFPRADVLPMIEPQTTARQDFIISP